MHRFCPTIEIGEESLNVGQGLARRVAAMNVELDLLEA